jgi:hypothetical protein
MIAGALLLQSTVASGALHVTMITADTGPKFFVMRAARTFTAR